MAAHDHGPFVEPLGYQPVEFLDLPSLSDPSGIVAVPGASDPAPGPRDAGPPREASAIGPQQHHGSSGDAAVR